MFSHRHVATIIGLEGERGVMVTHTIDTDHGRNINRFQAVGTSITSTSIEELIEKVYAAWNREPTFEEQWQEWMAEMSYRSGYAYACGYKD